MGRFGSASPIPGVSSVSDRGRRISRVLLPFPMACPRSPFSPKSLTVPCPASPPSLSPGLGLCHPPQEGSQAARWFSSQSQASPRGSCGFLTRGQLTACSGDAVQPPPAPSPGAHPRGAQEPGSDPAGKCTAAELDSATLNVRG